MEDPVEAGARQEHDVGVLQCQGARPRNGQRMVVRHHALADDDERPLTLFEQVQGASTFSGTPAGELNPLEEASPEDAVAGLIHYSVL